LSTQIRLTYIDRLRNLYLDSLYCRRVKTDLPMCCDILKVILYFIVYCSYYTTINYIQSGQLLLKTTIYSSKVKVSHGNHVNPIAFEPLKEFESKLFTDYFYSRATNFSVL